MNADLTATLDGGLDSWKVTFEAGEITLTEEGEKLAKGETKALSFEGEIKGDEELPGK